MQKMLKEIHNRATRLGTFELEDWGQKNFGRAYGQSEIGKPAYFTSKNGYAIKGFWRGMGGMLNDIKHVLFGKG